MAFVEWEIDPAQIPSRRRPGSMRTRAQTEKLGAAPALPEDEPTSAFRAADMQILKNVRLDATVTKDLYKPGYLGAHGFLIEKGARAVSASPPKHLGRACRFGSVHMNNGSGAMANGFV